MGGIVQGESVHPIVKECCGCVEHVQHLKALKLPNTLLLRLLELHSASDSPQQEQLTQSTVDLEALLSRCGMENNKFTKRLFRLLRGGSSQQQQWPDATYYEFVLAYWDFCSLPPQQLPLFLFHLYVRQDQQQQFASDSSDGDNCSIPQRGSAAAAVDGSYSPRVSAATTAAAAAGGYSSGSVDDHQLQRMRMSAGDVRFMLMDLYGGNVSGYTAAAREAVQLAALQREDFKFSGASFSRRLLQQQLSQQPSLLLSEFTTDDATPRVLSPSTTTSRSSRSNRTDATAAAASGVVGSAFLLPLLRAQWHLQEHCLGRDFWKQQRQQRLRLAGKGQQLYVPLHCIVQRQQKNLSVDFFRQHGPVSAAAVCSNNNSSSSAPKILHQQQPQEQEQPLQQRSFCSEASDHSGIAVVTTFEPIAITTAAARSPKSSLLLLSRSQFSREELSNRGMVCVDDEDEDEEDAATERETDEVEEAAAATVESTQVDAATSATDTTAVVTNVATTLVTTATAADTTTAANGVSRSSSSGSSTAGSPSVVRLFASSLFPHSPSQSSMHSANSSNRAFHYQ